MSDTSPEEIGLILIYNGLNYDYDEISEQVGVSESTVSKYVNEVESEAKASDSPERVYIRRILPVFFGNDFYEAIAQSLR